MKTVITADNLRTVYGVTAEITRDDDAPHVILNESRSAESKGPQHLNHQLRR